MKYYNYKDNLYRIGNKEHLEEFRIFSDILIGWQVSYASNGKRIDNMKKIKEVESKVIKEN